MLMANLADNTEKIGISMEGFTHPKVVKGFPILYDMCVQMFKSLNLYRKFLMFKTFSLPECYP